MYSYISELGFLGRGEEDSPWSLYDKGGHNKLYKELRVRLSDSVKGGLLRRWCLRSNLNEARE